jgi:hypothetical protein
VPAVVWAQLSIQAPASAPAGSKVEVTWSGPSDPKDFITIVEKGTPEKKYARYQYAKKGTTMTFEVPDIAGDYEVRYLKGQGYDTLARRPITITKVTAEVQPPASVDAGAEFAVPWKGPSNQKDFITLVKAGTPETKYGRYVYARKGSPAKLRAPDEAGEYEVRYLTGQQYLTLASAPITVGKTAASLSGPTRVDAGSEFEIGWVGPNQRGDFITIVEAGTKEGSYKAYKYTKTGSPVVLRAPDETGKYEIRYATGQKYSTLATHAITIGPTVANLTAADRVKGGEPFEARWEGPDNRGDLITIVKAGAAEREYGKYAYTKRGNPSQVMAPLEEGDYELRYLTGQTYATLARRPIRVGPPDTQPGLLRVVASGTGEAVALPSGHAVELILDASGSMLQRQGGVRRIDIAKQVLTKLVRETLPAGTPFALRVFGHKEADSCRTDLEVPLSPLAAGAAASLIGGIEAKNLAKTPIADSLALVGQDLGAAKGQRLVILITDGEETCGGDPAQAIEKLKAAGIDVRVNVVGFAIDDANLKQTFRYWASVGGGSYFDAANSEELSQSLTGALRVPYDVYNGAGQIVAEGLTGGDAVELPAGTYRVATRATPPQVLETVVVKARETETVALR